MRGGQVDLAGIPVGMPLAHLVPWQAAARISVSLAGNIPCAFARLLDAAGENTAEGGQCVPMHDRSDGIRADLDRTQVAMVERFQTYLLELKRVKRELRRSLIAVQERLRGLDGTKAGILPRRRKPSSESRPKPTRQASCSSRKWSLESGRLLPWMWGGRSRVSGA